MDILDDLQHKRTGKVHYHGDKEDVPSACVCKMVLKNHLTTETILLVLNYKRLHHLTEMEQKKVARNAYYDNYL